MVTVELSEQLQRVKLIAGKPSATVADNVDANLVAASVDYLASAQALQSVERDPYWPKWNSPWWHMTLLWELGLVHRIPVSMAEAMVAALDEYYLHFFPLTEKEVPPGVDPLMRVMCHCGMGTMYQILHACGIDLDARSPWMRPWMLQYQMTEGGLNCDEAAYLKSAPKSSIVSTIPPMEALLHCTSRPFTPEELDCLQRGAQYLLQRKLFRSASSGDIINADWLKLTFPRFYEYDVLRGLQFLVDWALLTKQPLPVAAIAEAVVAIDAAHPDGCVRVERAVWRTMGSRIYDEQAGAWGKGECSAFPLLESVSAPGSVSPSLTARWTATKQQLQRLIASDLLKSSQ